MENMPSKATSRPIWKLRLSDNSDASWRHYGKNDPYYGVFSTDEFRGQNLNEATLKEFFDSGETQIDEVLQTARLHVNGGMATDAALDFGCGVGRLVLPLAKRFSRATGVDISSDYCDEAKRNCDRRGVSNVSFTENLSALLAAGQRFDFIHSSLVFNHIPWARGQKIITEMFQLLRPGGVIAIQVLHHQEIARAHRWARKARKSFLPLHWLINLYRGHHMFEPLMQANEYPLDELAPLFHRLGVKGIYIQPQPNENFEHWAFVFCMKEVT
jgi:2-polyprenyl-3-methyl-5-hydroxy-6-metoxy-1,4-benzoquinol methylase